MRKYTAKRKITAVDPWWIDICQKNDMKPDGTFLVTTPNFIPKNEIESLQLAGFSEEYNFNSAAFIFKEATDNFQTDTKNQQSEPNSNAVINPKHYDVMDEKVIEMIARCQTQEMFYGFCLGNVMKYRLRAGGKDDLVQEIQKADNYPNLYDKYKHLCYGEPKE